MNNAGRVALFFTLAAAILAAADLAAVQSELSLQGGSSALCPSVEQLSLDRPSSSAGPTPVGVGVLLNDLVTLDDVAQSFSTDLFLIMQWVDPRLAEPARGASLSICALDGQRVWMPSVQFQGVRRFDKHYQDITGIDSLGVVTHAQRLNLEVAVPLDLRDFPFDRHTLAVEVQPGVFGVDEVQFEVLTGLTGIEERVSLTGWTLGAQSASIETRYAPRIRVNQTLFRFEVEAAREPRFYMFKMMVPLVLIIFMSWAVFWIDPQQVGPQLGLAATSMLTLIAYQFAFLGLLPRISYLTRADTFILSSSVLVFLALVEAIVAASLARSGRTERANRLDRTSRLAFPALLALITVFAFAT